MKTWLKLSLPSLILLLCYSCTPSESTDSNEKEMTEESESSAKKTQALLLTQEFDFDPADKNKVTGDYIAQSKITVPPNFA